MKTIYCICRYNDFGISEPIKCFSILEESSCCEYFLFEDGSLKDCGIERAVNNYKSKYYNFEGKEIDVSWAL